MTRAVAQLARLGALAVAGLAQPGAVPDLPGGPSFGATDRPAPGRSPGSEPCLVEPATNWDARVRATDGLEWLDRTNSLSAEALAARQGVTTDKDGLTTTPELREDRVSGTIAPEFAELSNLWDLDLGEYRLRPRSGPPTARGRGGH